MGCKIYDIIILGAGASGLFCANLLDNNFSILLIEGSDSPAKKLLMSAKGRGNITNKGIIPNTDYSTDNNTFVETAFQRYGVSEFLSFLNKESIAVNEEDLGRILLKSNKVIEYKDYLLKNINKKGITIEYNTQIGTIEKREGTFCISTNNGQYYAKNLVVATGGPSFFQLGASSIAIKIAESFKLSFTPFYPALAGFEVSQDFSSLSGSSVIGDLTLINNDKIVYQQEGPILFTHRGLSGPCIFNASIFMREPGDYKIRINIDKQNITKRLLAFLGFRSNTLSNYIISTNVKNVRGLDEAKVCGGGVKTENLKDNFECKTINGLYFIGECLDVTGKTGGFNLQRCWTSGFICAQHLNTILQRS